MEKKDILTSLPLKMISFITLPILCIVLGISIFAIVYGMHYPEVKTDASYFETDAFRSNYESQLMDGTESVRSIKNRLGNYYGVYEDGTPTDMAVKDGEYTILYNSTLYYSDELPAFTLLVINPDNKEAYTNLPLTGKTDSIEKIQNILKQNHYYWNYEQGSVNTNISKMAEDEMKYKPIMKAFENNGNDVYTSLNETDTNDPMILMNTKIYDLTKTFYKPAYIIALISSILIVLETIYLIAAVGHKKKEEGIVLNWMDRIPLEIYSFLALMVVSIGVAFAIESGSMMEINIWYLVPCAICTYLSTLCANYALGSYIKRIKSKTFWKNSIVYRIYAFFKRKLKGVYEDLMYNVNNSFRLAIVLGGVVLLSIFILMTSSMFGAFSILILLGFWIYCYWFVLKRMKEFYEIKEATKQIYEGNTDVRLDEEKLKGVLKEFAVYVNDIAGGFSNAIEASLKNERLKTELITNVSHDIKTPLTSIINYVDLIKREDIQDEKVKEYVNILDAKSQRLKKLIEDLVEASKASSGNIKLQKENLNVKELLKQITGEFEDKFQEKGLQVIMDLPEEDTIVVADNRYLYRVIENLYSNISKYALENSRVYVDVLQTNGKIVIALKNISKESLNISADELMQRFVRGDRSRNTEGSGLGLSIARSLTELQGGKFNIYLDGDLFKVVIEF